MKKITRIALTALFLCTAFITISQLSRPASADAPITSSGTSSAPVTSAVTPTDTPTPTPTTAQTSQQSTSNSSNSSNSSNNSSNNNSNNNSSNSNKGPSICSATKPQAPTIVSAFSSGAGTVTLSWTKVKENITYYLVAFGRKPGVVEYGTPSVPSDVTKYVISGLAPRTAYYFRVRGGNGCMPGDFSPEVTVRANGQVIIGSTGGYKQTVLGTSNSTNKKNIPNKKSTSVKKVGKQIVNQSVSKKVPAKPTGFLQNIFGVVKNIFGN